MSEKQTRKIEVNALSRVEGEGALRIVLSDQQVVDVQLAIYEPPRFFEALLRGRPLEEAPDITSRICGICPVAYQMTSVHALERALGVTISPEIRRLRRLLYCAEWIESHGVHIHLLHIPDFFGCDSSIELAKRMPEEVNRGLRLKKHGNQLLEVIGGRAVNPINIAVGGFHRAPDRAKLRALVDDFSWGLDAAVEVARWVAEFDFPDFDRPCEMISLQHDEEYPMNEGPIASTKGWNIEVPEFEHRFQEKQSPHSTALHCVRLPTETPYFVGPLARINLNRDRLFPAARQLSDEVGIGWPSFNPHHSIVARALEVVHAYEESLEILRDYQPPEPARIDYQPQPCEGAAATEAPRGLIYNRYRVDQSGLIEFAKIVPPTSQNQRQIESDLRVLLPELLHGDDQQTALACEKLIRSYDPCISCSTHFLTLEIEQMNVSHPRTMVVGIGSPNGDDQAGWLVVDRLSATVPNSCQLHQVKVPHALLDFAADIDRLHLVDACDSDSAAREVNRFEIVPSDRAAGDIDVYVRRETETVRLPKLRANTSHQVDVLSVLRLLVELKSFPGRVVVWTITGREFGPGGSLSAGCEANIQACADRISEELADA